MPTEAVQARTSLLTSLMLAGVSYSSERSSILYLQTVETKTSLDLALAEMQSKLGLILAKDSKFLSPLSNEGRDTSVL